MSKGGLGNKSGSWLRPLTVSDKALSAIRGVIKSNFKNKNGSFIGVVVEVLDFKNHLVAIGLTSFRSFRSLSRVKICDLGDQDMGFGTIIGQTGQLGSIIEFECVSEDVKIEPGFTVICLENKTTPNEILLLNSSKAETGVGLVSQLDSIDSDTSLLFSNGGNYAFMGIVISVGMVNQPASLKMSYGSLPVSIVKVNKPGTWNLPGINAVVTPNTGFDTIFTYRESFVGLLDAWFDVLDVGGGAVEKYDYARISNIEPGYRVYEAVPEAIPYKKNGIRFSVFNHEVGTILATAVCFHVVGLLSPKLDESVMLFGQQSKHDNKIQKLASGFIYEINEPALLLGPKSGGLTHCKVVYFNDLKNIDLEPRCPSDLNYKFYKQT